MKIYVCECGCKYEGGYAFLATSSYIEAWKAIRAKRFNEEIKSISEKERVYFKLIDKNHWESKYDFLSIKVFDEYH